MHSFRSVLLLLAGLALGTGLLAQGPASQSPRTMSQGTHNAYTLDLPGLSDKQAADVWATYSKAQFGVKAKYSRKTKEHFSDNAQYPAIGGANTIDVYASIGERPGGAEIVLWFDLGGAYLGSAEHPERQAATDAFLHGLSRAAEAERIGTQLKAEEKVLKTQEKDLKDLEREQERLIKDIADYEDKIRRARQRIEENKAEQEALRLQLEQQRSAVQQTKGALEKVE